MLEMEEGNHKPRNVRDLQKLEKSKKQILFETYKKGMWASDTLILAGVGLLTYKSVR